jgi:hypothetical protein
MLTARAKPLIKFDQHRFWQIMLKSSNILTLAGGPMPIFILVAIAGLPTTFASPIPNPFNFNTFLHDVLPNKGYGTIQDELQCYSLPYGGIGFASHVLTYWTVTCLAIGVKPLKPWSRLKYDRWDFFLAIISLIICVPLAAFTIVRCLGRWQFVLLAVWKTTMSFTLAVVGMHRSITLRRIRRVNGQAETSAAIFAWLIIYGLGTIVGLAGLLSLVGEHFSSNREVQIISYVFGGLISFLSLCVFLGIFLVTRSESKDEPDGKSWKKRIGDTGLSAFFSCIIGIICVGMLAAFYSDWILGAIARNGWSGAPTDDNAWLYWSYFVAKRLPLASL